MIPVGRLLASVRSGFRPNSGQFSSGFAEDRSATLRGSTGARRRVVLPDRATGAPPCPASAPRAPAAGPSRADARAAVFSRRAVARPQPHSESAHTPAAIRPVSTAAADCPGCASRSAPPCAMPPWCPNRCGTADRPKCVAERRDAIQPVRASVLTAAPGVPSDRARRLGRRTPARWAAGGSEPMLEHSAVGAPAWELLACNALQVDLHQLLLKAASTFARTPRAS